MAKRREEEQKEQLTNDEDDPSKLIDAEGLAMMQQHLVNLLMGCPDDKIAALLLECIALMSKRFVQKDWPSLISELSSHLQQTENMQNTKRALEAIKKICKKYRYMFRSDDLYREMNYMIENLSPLLLQNLIVSVFSRSMGLYHDKRARLSFFLSLTNDFVDCHSSPSPTCRAVFRWARKQFPRSCSQSK